MCVCVCVCVCVHSGRVEGNEDYGLLVIIVFLSHKSEGEQTNSPHAPPPNLPYNTILPPQNT